MISGMKDKLWIYCYKRMGLYKLFKYMRAHKYSDRLTKWKDFNGGKNKTYIK